jgi:hypothetical protein
MLAGHLEASVAHAAGLTVERWGESSPLTLLERRAVLDQLERIVSHRVFKNSKRCVCLLSFLVDHALDDQNTSIKERTLGIEVFGRSPDYDTSSDPIVRTTANEIRKRLAQYYREVERADELEIELIPGSYLPTFKFPAQPSMPLPTVSASVFDDRKAESIDDADRKPRSQSIGTDALRPRWKPKTATLAGVCLAVLFICVAGAMLARRSPSPNLEQFWHPVLGSSDPVLICVGTGDFGRVSPSGIAETLANLEKLMNGTVEPPSRAADAEIFPALQLADAAALSHVSGFLSEHNRKFVLRTVSAVTLADLRNGPIILLGMLDNPWTLRLTSGLRFHPRIDPTSQSIRIEDSQHPQQHDWMSYVSTVYSDSSVDYALISRVQDQATGNIVIEIGGLGLHGTQAAGEFITSSKFLDTVPRGSFVEKNVQIVLKTSVINGESGPPQVVAIYRW